MCKKERGRAHLLVFFFSSRRRHTRCSRDWSSDVCSSDLAVRVESLRPVGSARAVRGGHHPNADARAARRPLHIARGLAATRAARPAAADRESTRLNSSHGYISYAVLCLEKKKDNRQSQAS